MLDALGAGREVVERAVDERRAGGPVGDAEALATLGIDLDEVRRQVEDAFGPGALERTRAASGRGAPFGGHIPFERAAKKALELALREALRARARLHRHRAPPARPAARRRHGRRDPGRRGLRLNATRSIVEEMVRHRRAG